MLKKQLSRLVFAVLMLFVGLSLFACKQSSSATPYGDLKEDNKVFTAKYNNKDYGVSELDLYKDFRRQDADTLNRLVEEKSLSSYVTQIDYQDRSENGHREFLVKHFNKTIFGSDDDKKLQFSDAANLYKSLMTFISSHNYGSTYPVDKLKEKMIELIDKDPLQRDFKHESEDLNDLLTLGALELAKKLYAREELVKLVDKKKDKNYIKDDKEASKNDYLTKFRNSEKNKFGVKFFAVDLTSDDELNQILYDIAHLPIKISSNGTWYYIPDIRRMRKQDFEGNSQYKYLKKYIEDDLLKKKLNVEKYKTFEDVLDGKIDKDGFNEYMTSYKIDANRGNGDYQDQQISKNDPNKKAILEILIKIYNKIHSRAEEQLTLEGSTIHDFKIKRGDKYYKTEFTADEMKKHLLKSEVYDTLKFNYKDGNVNLDKSKLLLERLTKVYGNSNGGGRKYLIFKFGEGDERKQLNEIFNYEKNEFIDPKDNAELKAKLDAKKTELKKQIIEDKLTTSFINEQFKKYLKDKNLKVYDPLQRISFKKKKIEYTNTSKNQFLDNDTIAEINGIKITVREFYNEMVAKFGVGLAVSKIYSQVVLDAKPKNSNQTYADLVTKEDKDAIYKAIKNDIDNFGRGYNKNYDAQIGRDLYLQHAYGVNTLAEAVAKAEADKAKEYFSKDMPNIFGEYYKNLATLAGEYYNKAFTMKVQHLLFSVDDDLDGTPDNPASLSAERRAEIENALRPLFSRLKIEQSKGLKNLLKNIDDVIADYVKASRYVKDRSEFSNSEDYEKYTKTADYIYGNLKKAGISIKKEDIKDKITEKSFAKYDKVFFERCKYLYSQLKDSKEFPQADIINEFPFTLEQIQSAFGWHQILVESVEKPKSAKTNKDYTSKLQHEGNPLKVSKNDKDEVTEEQVSVYLREANEKKYTIAVEGKDAIKAQLDPILSRINAGGEFGILLLFQLFKMNNGQYRVSDSIKNVFEIYKDTAVNKFNDFAWRKLADGTTKIYNKQYAELWTDYKKDKNTFTKDFLTSFGINPF